VTSSCRAVTAAGQRERAVCRVCRLAPHMGAPTHSGGRSHCV
jgi:hypothetical protein